MFQPEKLRADFNSYEPYIEKEIMELHYSKHYFGYINNLNNALQKYPEYFKKSIKEILSDIDGVPADIRDTVRNNGGGAINHELFWEILSTKTDINVPAKLKSVVEKSFTSMNDLKETMLKKLGKHFGSGWVWLVVNKNKELKVYSLPNQDSPYMLGDTPILGIDIWEHAYYLQYKNVRADYLENVWKIIDWNVVEQKYNSALA